MIGPMPVTRPKRCPEASSGRGRSGRCLLPFTAAVFLLVACSRAGEIGRASVGDLRLTLRSEPAPLAVGQGARIEVDLHRPNGEPVSACRLDLARRMPGMTMEGDDRRHPMRVVGEGLYETEVGEFRMGGDWRLTVGITCRDGKRHEANFDLHIPWPE